MPGKKVTGPISGALNAMMAPRHKPLDTLARARRYSENDIAVLQQVHMDAAAVSRGAFSEWYRAKMENAEPDSPTLVGLEIAALKLAEELQLLRISLERKPLIVADDYDGRMARAEEKEENIRKEGRK